MSENTIVSTSDLSVNVPAQDVTTDVSIPSDPSPVQETKKKGKKDRKTRSNTSSVPSDAISSPKTGKGSKKGENAGEHKGEGKKQDVQKDTKEGKKSPVKTIRETFLALNASRKDTTGRGGIYNILPEKKKGERISKKDLFVPATREGTIHHKIVSLLSHVPISMKEIKQELQTEETYYDFLNRLWRTGQIGKTESGLYFLLPLSAFKEEKKNS